MGVIFRNGIPYGATESDVTTVYEKADLYDLTDKRENHLYIVEEENKPYRYDLETNEFYPIGASDTPPIIASKYQVLIGDGNNWATHNNWYAQHNPAANESALYARDADTIVLGGGTVPEREDAPLNYDGWLIPDGPFFKIAGDSRLTVSEGAWADITGAGTEFKVNSGSKFFVDSMYGKNNMYMHGGFIVINDAKESSYSKPKFYYYVLKSEFPDKPDADLEFFDENGVIYSKSQNFSTNYPYKTAEATIINSSTVKGSDLTDVGYTYTLSSVISTSMYIGGQSTPVWRLDVNFLKTEPEYPETHISGSIPYGYNFDYSWPEESQGVPRINITGAPHIKIQDYSVVSMETGARLDLNKQCQLIASQSFTTLYGSYLMLQSNQNTKFAPYIMLNDCDTVSQHQISLGFTSQNPQSSSIPNPPIESSMLSTPAENHCDITMSDVNLGPYKNYVIQKMQFNGRGYMATWMENTLNSEYKYNYLPLVHYGGRVYIQVSTDSGSDYVINPQVAGASRHVYAPDITGYSVFDIAPYLSNSSKFAAKFGGTNAAVTCIQYCPKGGNHSVLINPEQGCDTYFKDERESGTNLAMHIKSKAGSNMLFTLNGGMGNGAIYDQATIGYNGRPGTIQKLIEGIDTFELESGQIHKEMRDDARFIMRGENYASLNNPSVSYQNDISQGKWENGFGRFSKSTCHLNKYWDRPINNEDFKKSPTFQMYECSNLILRGFWKYPERSITIPTDAYASLTEDTPISLEELKSHTTEWEYFLGCFDSDEEFIGLVPESQIIATSTNIVVQRANFQFTGDSSYVKKYHPNAGLDTFGKRSSLLEITDNSELRLWDGICIYGRYDPQTNEPGIEIVNRYGTNGTDMNETNVEAGDNKEPIDRVTFTFTELKQLKALLTQIPIQVVQSSAEATEPGIMYFVDGGGN